MWYRQPPIFADTNAESPVQSVLLSLKMCSTCGFGLNLIKLSHLKATGASPALAPTRFNRKGTPTQARFLWAAGYIFNALGGCLNLCGLRFAAQSLIAPLSSVVLIANLFFATFILGERFRISSDAAPLLLIGAGNILAVGSASHRQQEALTLRKIVSLFERSQFRAYLVAVAISSAVLMLVRARIRLQIRRNGGEEFASPALLARAGLCHTAAAAMLSVNTVLLSKASVLALAGGLGNALTPQFLTLFATWLTLALFWIYTLNRLLASHEMMFVVPAIEVIWSLLSLLSGSIFFQEWEDVSRRRIVAFATGVLLNLTGVWLLTKRSDKSGKIG